MFLKVKTRHAICAFLFLIFGAASARSDVMLFQAFGPEDWQKTAMNDYGWKIFAVGEIDGEAGKRLAELLAQKKVPIGSRLYLHSPGGSLTGGMALGRVIRENRLHTLIGQRDPKQDYVGSKSGYCLSACATAFLGGEFRYWTEGSIYGVHRFYWDKESADDAARAQVLSAIVVDYIRSMGVDTRIFSLASQAGETEVVTPPHEVLLALNVVNDGRKRPKWTIESIPEAMYLKGEQETDNGMNKLMMVCFPRDPTMFLYAIFDGGNGAERNINWPVHWLFLDYLPVRLDRQLVSKKIMNGMFNLMYRMDSNLIASISKAKVVGVGMQPTSESKVFLGFDSMPFAEGSAKLAGFASICSSSAPNGRSKPH
jgi:hypothetical protein